ncbi:MAG: DnaJ domain-containing protein [Alphaproteobacteria bacterium]|jgi:DnaJ-class molecular chaperone
MDKNEAFEILGLDFKASRDDIINAHKKLIEKNHPDKGGSDYLSAKINKARDVLLDNK